MYGKAIVVRTLTAVLAVSSWLALRAQTDAPTQRPVFKTGVNYVEVDANVVDANGKFVEGLTKNDFTVTEDGRPQTVSVFSVVQIPVEARPELSGNVRHVGPADAASNPPFRGRIFALVLDEQQTSFSATHRAVRAAEEFVTKYVGADDLVAVVSTGGAVSQGLTSDLRRVMTSLDHFMGQQAPSAAAAAAADAAINADLPWFAMPTDINRRAVGREKEGNIMFTLGLIRDLSEYLGRIPDRRKALVMFGGGIQGGDDTEQNGYFHQAVEAANRSNVAIYSVDVRGLPEAGTPLQLQTYGDDPDAPGAASSLRDEFQSGQHGAISLSNQTGGFAVTSTNTLGPAFERIIHTASRYYVLGYYPANDAHDGKFHTISVKVARPGVTIRSRAGYVAPDDKKHADEAVAHVSPQLAAALASPLPVSDVPLHVSAAAFLGTGSKSSISLTVEMDATGFSFNHAGDEFTDRVELAVLSGRSSHKVQVDASEGVGLSLRDNYQDVRARGIRIGQHLDLAPGHYRLMIGVREQNAGAIGTVPLDVDIPDFSKHSLALSGILLTSVRSAQVPTTHADLSLKDILPAPPTANREFSRDDVLTAFAEVYDNARGASATPSLSAQILGANDAVVYDSTTHPAGAIKKTDARTYRYVLQIPLTPLEPGRYRLRFNGTSAGSKAVFSETSLTIK